MSALTIKNEINELLEAGFQETHNILMENYNKLVSASYTKEEAAVIVYIDNNALVTTVEIGDLSTFLFDVIAIQASMVKELYNN